MAYAIPCNSFLVSGMLYGFGFLRHFVSKPDQEMKFITGFTYFNLLQTQWSW